MPKIIYKEKRFSAPVLEIIEHARRIINEYTSAGYRLTLRQLYYQFVARDILPNKQKEYKRLGDIIGDARLTGMIDWNALEDRGRNLLKRAEWTSPQDIIGACARQYRCDVWADQGVHVEVWIEKEALIGVIEPICDELRIGAFACKGYVSLSEMWDAAYNRLQQKASEGKNPVILHMGDHDPSGIDMTRDIRERVNMLSMGAGVEVIRIALNFDQIEEFEPPPNPAKSADPRFRRYTEEFGDESWELDALPPDVLVGLVRDHVNDLMDQRAFRKAIKAEKQEREAIGKLADQWDRVQQFLKGA